MSAGNLVLRGALTALVAAILDGAVVRAESGCGHARLVCVAAARLDGAACRSGCRRSPDPACAAGCTAQRDGAFAACRAVQVPCAALCGAGVTAEACAVDVHACRASARRDERACRQTCNPAFVGGLAGCRERCRRARASAERGCGYVVADAAAGAAVLPDLPGGRPADLSLLEPEERAVIAAADARAEGLHTRRVRLSRLSPERLHTGSSWKRGRPARPFAVCSATAPAPSVSGPAPALAKASGAAGTVPG